MKPQKYPKSVIKPGVVLYSVTGEAYTNGDTEIEVHTHLVTSIMKKRGTQSRQGRKSSLADFYNTRWVHLVEKIKYVTWVKLSRKHFDWGFKKSISKCYKTSFMEGSNLPNGYYTTLLPALKYCRDDILSSIKCYKQDIKEETDPQELEDTKECLVAYEKLLKKVKLRINKLSK